MSKFGSNAPLTERFKYDPCSVSEEELLDALQELEKYKYLLDRFHFTSYRELYSYLETTQ